MKKIIKFCLIATSLVSISGCWRIGPDKLAADRLSYTAIVGDSWKEQMLLNLVKIRYGDVPVFVDVQNVLAQYSLAGQVTMGGNFSGNSQPNTPHLWGSSINGNLQYQDRPTISFVPMSGSKFGKSLMSPVTVSAITSLLQSGYPGKMIFRMITHSINGLDNMFAFKPRQDQMDADFFRLVDTMTEIQRAGLMSIVSINNKNILHLLPTEDPGLNQAMNEFRRLLKLRPDGTEYQVVYGTEQGDPDEIAIFTRSILDILSDLAGYIEVPLEDNKLHRVFPSQPATSVAGKPLAPLLRIHSGSSHDVDSFVSISYHGQKFWLDNHDIDSKITFSSLMFLFGLVDSDKGEGGPSLVIPAG